MKGENEQPDFIAEAFKMKKNTAITPAKEKIIIHVLSMIYDMYLDGMGMRKIQFALEAAGRKTSTGLTHWYSSYISRILNNPFYC